jgi:hypothetical protein
MIRAILAMTILFAIGALAAEALKVKKGSTITVNQYDTKTNLFVVAIQGEAIGPNYVTPENLRKAIAFEGSPADFMNQKAQMTGSMYQLKKPLPLLSESEVLKIAKKVVKKENKK